MAMSMAVCSEACEAMVAVVGAMVAKTAAAMGSSGVGAVGVDGVVGGRGNGVRMAFSVRARMAFLDFLVPKARPRVVRVEGCCEARGQGLVDGWTVGWCVSGVRMG